MNQALSELDCLIAARHKNIDLVAFNGSARIADLVYTGVLPGPSNVNGRAQRQDLRIGGDCKPRNRLLAECRQGAGRIRPRYELLCLCKSPFRLLALFVGCDCNRQPQQAEYHQQVFMHPLIVTA